MSSSSSSSSSKNNDLIRIPWTLSDSSESSLESSHNNNSNVDWKLMFDGNCACGHTSQDADADNGAETRGTSLSLSSSSLYCRECGGIRMDQLVAGIGLESCQETTTTTTTTPQQQPQQRRRQLVQRPRPRSGSQGTTGSTGSTSRNCGRVSTGYSRPCYVQPLGDLRYKPSFDIIPDSKAFYGTVLRPQTTVRSAVSNRTRQRRQKPKLNWIPQQ